MTLYRFEQGYSYLAGIDKPALVPASTIIDAVTDEGFKVLFADECSRWATLPFATPTACGDWWDWLGFAYRWAPTKLIDVPDRVRWIQKVPHIAAPPQPLQPYQPQPATLPRWKIGAAAAAAAAAAVWWIFG